VPPLALHGGRAEHVAVSALPLLPRDAPAEEHPAVERAGRRAAGAGERAPAAAAAGSVERARAAWIARPTARAREIPPRTVIILRSRPRMRKPAWAHGAFTSGSFVAILMSFPIRS